MTTPATTTETSTKRVKAKTSAKSALTERDQLLRRYLKQENLKPEEMKKQNILSLRNR